MKYYSRLKLYKAPNLVFNPATKKAYSYKWYELVSVINGKLVLNTYRYSNTTARHYREVSCLLDKLGINIDMRIEAPKGLQNLESAKDHYLWLINELNSEINNPRSQKSKNIERKKQVKEYERIIKFLKIRGRK